MSRYFKIDNIQNLSLEGGGIAGIAYAGMLKVLEEKGILANIKRVGGTSAGSIAAILLCVGYSPKQIEAELKGMDFASFKDSSFGIIRNIYRVLHRYGLYKGEVFNTWLKQKIEEKTGNADITFCGLNRLRQQEIKEKGETRLKQPFLVASDLTSQTVIIFSHEHSCQYRHKPLWFGVRASMSIPGFFSAIKTSLKHWLVDGGLILNDPQIIFDDLKYFSCAHDRQNLSVTSTRSPMRQLCRNAGFNHYRHNPETLAVRLETTEEIERKSLDSQTIRQKISSVISYVLSLLHTAQSTQTFNYLNSHNPERTIEINRQEVRATDFNITPEMTSQLLESGKEATELFLHKHSLAQSNQASEHFTPEIQHRTAPLVPKYGLSRSASISIETGIHDDKNDSSFSPETISSQSASSLGQKSGSRYSSAA